MSFKKNFKRNLLNKSDMYNFYKSEYEECNKNYQNILHVFPPWYVILRLCDP